jgi:hypothetical protein
MNLLFDFTVDKAAQKVFITREFDADLSLVWDAFTTAETARPVGSPQTVEVENEIYGLPRWADADFTPW